MARPPKKSETIEIRLSHEAKSSFAARCRAEGRTVSEAVREFVENPPKARSTRSPASGLRLLAAAAAGLAVGGIAAPSLAHPAQNARAVFDRLDRNHDGVLSFEEFSRR